MHLEQVDVVGRQIPFADAFPVSYEDHVFTDHLFVRIQTDTGITGYGEGTALPWFTGETTAGMVAAAEEWFTPLLEGESLDDAVADFDAHLDTVPGNPGAKAGFELALLDLLGKRAKRPVHELLGPTVRETIPLVYPIPGVDADRAAELVDDGLDRGFRRFKIKATGDLAGDIDRIDTVLGALPGGATARVDPNTSWETATTAQSVLDQLDATDQLEYIEQPTDPARPAELRQLWDDAGIPVFADEYVHDLTDVVHLADEHLAAGCHLKLAKAGSLRRMSTMAAVANRFGLAATPVSAMGTSLEATAICHLAATIRKIPLACELDPALIDEDPTTDPLEIEPEISVPAGPGLGVGLDDSVFAG